MQKGFIYVLTNSALPGKVKIGKTGRDPVQRAAELSTGSGVIGRFEVHFHIECDDIDHAEALTHQALKMYRFQNNREFFDLDAIRAVDIIKRCVSLIQIIDDVAQVGSDESATPEINVAEPASYQFRPTTSSYPSYQPRRPDQPKIAKKIVHQRAEFADHPGKYTAFLVCPKCWTGFSQELELGDDEAKCPNCERF